MKEAAKIYRYVASRKGNEDFVTEVSTDETNTPQSPAELFFVLAALAHEQVPIQTIAPKFTGHFLKGIDYVGDVAQFAREFEQDVAVVAYAIREFDLPETLKISIHSGSDKFSLYPVINTIIKKFGAGLHLKTAGTTWLEEVIGLAMSGSDGLSIAKEIYSQSYARFDELAKPYLAVIDIRKEKLPAPAEVNKWGSAEFVMALKHDSSCPRYNTSFRQLIHIGFKVAAEMGDRFTDALDKFDAVINEGVAENLYERHLLPDFSWQRSICKSACLEFGEHFKNEKGANDEQWFENSIRRCLGFGIVRSVGAQAGSRNYPFQKSDRMPDSCERRRIQCCSKSCRLFSDEYRDRSAMVEYPIGDLDRGARTGDGSKTILQKI